MTVKHLPTIYEFTSDRKLNSIYLQVSTDAKSFTSLVMRQNHQVCPITGNEVFNFDKL